MGIFFPACVAGLATAGSADCFALVVLADGQRSPLGVVLWLPQIAQLHGVPGKGCVDALGRCSLAEQANAQAAVGARSPSSSALAAAPSATEVARSLSMRLPSKGLQSHPLAGIASKWHQPYPLVSLPVPQNGWFIMENLDEKWMITRGTPILEKTSYEYS